MADDAHDGHEIERRPSRDERECEEFVGGTCARRAERRRRAISRDGARAAEILWTRGAIERGEFGRVCESIVEAAVKVRTNGGWVGLGSIKDHAAWRQTEATTGERIGERGLARAHERWIDRYEG